MIFFYIAHNVILFSFFVDIYIFSTVHMNKANNKIPFKQNETVESVENLFDLL